MDEEIVAKRALGNGRWDRALKKNMVELSNADNYDEAKHEWIATGEVWWSQIGDCPEWAAKHLGQCLCRHRVVYHFEILNTENGVRECVGSDHINSYLILRAIREETGLKPEEITEEMIQEWIDVRVNVLKSNAWWKQFGDQFTEMFDTVKEFDLRVNVRETGWDWDRELRMKRPKTVIRKRADGKYGDSGYLMASLVWRWNHPDNPKNQRDKHGYPNERLYNDLQLFYVMLEQHKAKIAEEDAMRAKRIVFLAKHDAEQAEKEIQLKENAAENLRVAASMRDDNMKDQFEQMCEYYDIPEFTVDMGGNAWETKFLTDIKTRLEKGNNLSDKQLEIVRRIITGGQRMATSKQMSYLRHLGYDGEEVSFTEASRLIDEIINKED